MTNSQDLKLIETVLYRPLEGLQYFDDHMDRLGHSCKALQFEMPQYKTIRQEIMAVIAENDVFESCKIRILYTREGQLSVELIPIQTIVSSYPLSIVLHQESLSISDNPLVFHKTTDESVRGVYAKVYQKYHAEQGVFDVIFMNEKGHITEGSRTNVFIKQGMQYFTPQVSCGLLPGIIRKKLLSKFDIKETDITVAQFKQADEILLSNSIWGIVKAKLLNL